VTVKDVMKRAIDTLKGACIETPTVDAGVMLCHVLNCDRTYIYTHVEYELNEDEFKKFNACISRRAEGIPVQYITGHQEFMSLDFKVVPEVLIPRHDTEILVESVIRHTKALQHSCEETCPGNMPWLNILDIGTGSGCIAVSLAFYIRQSRIKAVDISEKALEIALNNAVNAGVGDRIEFVKGDILSEHFSAAASSPRFDIIVSNPPYIPQSDILGLQKEVRDFEPTSALNGGADGLDFYRAIVKNAAFLLKPQGLLAFEVGLNQADDVIMLMGRQYYDIGVTRDLAHISRVVTGRMRVQ